MDNFKINTANPVYEEIYQKLYEYLIAKEEIKMLLPSSIIQTLLSIIASISSGQSSNILTAYQENFLQTAQNPENILAKCALDFGVFIKRKDPAKITVQMQNLSVNSVTIPRFSKFSINQTSLFNREEIVLIPGELLSATLYQGEKISEDFISVGEYDTFFLKTKNFEISSEDIYLEDKTNNEIYECITEPLFTTGSSSEAIVQNITLPDGSTMIKFGNGIYGKLPTTGSNLTVYYIKTKGTEGNENIPVDSIITYDNSDILIKTTSSLLEGQDELSTEYYRNFGSAMKSAQVIGGCVTLEQLKYWALLFRDTIDCQLLGQRDTFPSNLRYLNVIQATVLTKSGILSDTDWEAFINHMREKTNLEFTKVDPIGLDVDINIEVFIPKDLISDSIKTKITNEFSEYFTPKLGYIGQSFYISDIGKILRKVLGENELIRYNVIFPTSDKVIERTQFLKLGAFVLNIFSE